MVLGRNMNPLLQSHKEQTSPFFGLRFFNKFVSTITNKNIVLKDPISQTNKRFFPLLGGYHNCETKRMQKAKLARRDDVACTVKLIMRVFGTRSILEVIDILRSLTHEFYCSLLRVVFFKIIQNEIFSGSYRKC